MTNSYLDKSNYLRGLLLLSGKNKSISPNEKNFLLKVGEVIGFDLKFIEGAIKEFFINEYIKTEPPIFSKSDYAKTFLKDAIKLAFVDNNFDRDEFEWIESVAKKNNISKDWIYDEITMYAKSSPFRKDEPLEIEKFFSPMLH